MMSYWIPSEKTEGEQGLCYLHLSDVLDGYELFWGLFKYRAASKIFSK